MTRIASRPSFPVQHSERESGASIFGYAVGGLIAISLLLGTIAWVFNLTLVDAGVIDSSWSWWVFVRFAGLLHLLRGVLVVWFKRRG